MRASSALSGLAVGMMVCVCARADGPAPPTVTDFSLSNSQVHLGWTPYPAAEDYQVLSALTPVEVFEVELGGTRSGFSWTGTSAAGSGFYRVAAIPMEDDALLTANVLNRLAYGPTPDDLERIYTGPAHIGPDAFIEEQLHPESLPDSLDTEPANTDWVYVTATGTSAAGRVYLYFSGAGQVHVDDLKLVKGTEAQVGANLVTNGDFESALAPKWIATANFKDSAVSSAVAHSGSQSLLLVGTAAGTGSGNAFYQEFTGWKAGDVYTLSFWYLPTNQSVRLTVRLSGSTTTTEQPVAATPPPISDAYGKLQTLKADIATLRTWFVLRAVQSKRQLFEILTQFFENHFVTQHSKTVDYFDRYYNDQAYLDRLATSLEFREISRWRGILLKPEGTFRELLKASAESVAQIIYLDTVGSRGDGKNIANENYSRELLELDTFGVDNGYDQQDITVMSRAWTGWSIRLVDADKVSDPLAPQSTTQLDTTITNATAGSISNLVGVWTFGYRTNRHNNSLKTIFPGKTVPERFGSPWAGRNYELKLPARSGNASINDGYDIVNHLADQPFTEEFISVKLCRLFVHEDFQHGVYDYRDPGLSEEGKLVHACMVAWENGQPKGQLRDVLRVIFQSELFRKHGSSMQKVKTPLEFCVSSIRALRADLGGGKFSASTDGGSIVGRSRTATTAPLTRMGGMRLFNRAEPDGYPESAGGWISGGTLADRAHFIQSFLMLASDPAKGDDMSGGNKNLCDPVKLLKKKLGNSQWTDASAVVDYFLGVLFRAEGKANLAEYHASAVRFMNLSDDGNTASPFNLLGVDTPAYDTRVRAVVSLLMMSTLFQEQ